MRRRPSVVRPPQASRRDDYRFFGGPIRWFVCGTTGSGRAEIGCGGPCRGPRIGIGDGIGIGLFEIGAVGLVIITPK